LTQQDDIFLICREKIEKIGNLKGTFSNPSGGWPQPNHE